MHGAQMPVLRCEVADDETCSYLEGVALAGRTIVLPLMAAPASTELHVLEVRAPGREPIRFLAQPVGEPTAEGYSLRLQPQGHVLQEPTMAGVTPQALLEKSRRRDSLQTTRAGVTPQELLNLAKKSENVDQQMTRAGVTPQELLRQASPANLDAMTRAGVTPQELLRQASPANPDAMTRAGVTPQELLRQASPANPDAVTIPPPRDATGPDGSYTAVAQRAPTGASSEDPLIGRGLAGGKLSIEARVGRGGAGSVYRARHRDLRMHVAVKVMLASYQSDRDFCQRFHAEALSASRLDHANLTRVLDFGQEPDGLLYIAMEFLDGVSLRKLVKAEGRLGLERALALMIQVCTGLTHVHARGVVHRDIKPENLMVVKGLDDDGRETELVKVCDFGIAHAASTDDPLVLYAGTPSYMAPELFAGVEPDVSSDVYACGVVLYELLTGEKPVQGADSRELLKKLYTSRIVPPSEKVQGLDPRTDAIALKCLATDPKARYSSMLVLRADLRDIIGVPAAPGSVSEPRPAPAPAPPPSPAPPLVREPPRAEEMLTPAPASAAPDWLERGPVSTHMQGGTTALEAAGPTARERSQFAKTAGPFLKMLVDVTDPVRFAALIAPLDQKIPLLVQQGQIETVWRVRNVLEIIGAEASPRSPQVAAILRIFDLPAVLTPLADKAIEGHDDREKSASKLVAMAGAAGARAAYTARLRNLSYESRERFVEVMTDIGAPGAPVVRGALAHLEAHYAKRGVPDLMEDLLRALPRLADEATGPLLGRLARVESPAVVALAATALPKVWGDQARPILVELFAHPDDDVAVAAIRGLSFLNAIDSHLLQRLGANVLGTATARMPVRLASIDALIQSKGPLAKQAREILVHAVATLGGTTEAEDVLMAIAGAFLAGGGDPAYVAERWRSSTGNLRIRLEALLRPHVGK